MKDKNVCKGCKYRIGFNRIPVFCNSCDYSAMTGHSRLVEENKNGGYRKDSCVCYEAGQRVGRGIIPWGFTRGGE